MPRYRSRMALRPINRIKHVVDFTGTPTAATQIDNILIDTTDTPTLADTNGVETGSKVNGIYLKVEVASIESEDIGAIPNVYMIITKAPADNISVPSASAVGANDNKRFVIHQEMIMLNNFRGGNPRILFNGVVVIPKGMRRFGPKDRLYCSVVSPTINIAFCGQCHFKEFR